MFPLSGFACRDIKLIMEGKPHKLLESVAEDIAGTVLQDYEKVLGIKIKIQKPQVAIEGVVKYLGEHSLQYYRLVTACTPPRIVQSSPSLPTVLMHVCILSWFTSE